MLNFLIGILVVALVMLVLHGLGWLVHQGLNLFCQDCNRKPYVVTGFVTTVILMGATAIFYWIGVATSSLIGR
jgi:hypothetical protein